MNLRIITENQIRQLKTLDAHLCSGLSFIENKHRCMIAGGYLHGDRKPKDVDIFVDSGKDSESIIKILKLSGFYNFYINPKVDSNKIYKDSSYCINCLSHNFEVPVHIVVINERLDFILNDTFPLNMQKVAKFPNGSWKMDKWLLCHMRKEITCKASKLIKCSKSIKKYKAYYPDFKFIIKGI